MTGAVFAQGPRAGNDVPGWRGAADATQTETRTQLRDPEADHDPAVDPARDRVRDQAQQRVEVDDAGRGSGPARGVATGEPFGPRHAELAEALGMTDEELRDAIAGGASWAELAEEAGVSLDEMPTRAGGPGRPNRADRPQAGAAEPQGRMQEDALRARRGGSRF
ncbi:MAG: hypothetical protein R6T96_06775 [Longimicrobiales bacterium]